MNPAKPRGRNRILTRLFGRALVTAMLALSVVGVGTVTAHHSYAGVTIAVRRVNDVNISSYQAYAACTQAYCFVQVELSKRDLHRMNAWCGDTSTTLVVSNVPGANTNAETCEGPSTWHMFIIVDTYEAPGSLATHDSPVTIEVQAIPQS